MEAERKSFSKIAFDQFLKNKPAIVGLIIIWILVTIAVFAPLLANSKPLAIKTIQKSKYENSFYVYQDAVLVITEADKTNAYAYNETKSKSAATMKTELTNMTSILPHDQAALLKDYHNKLTALINSDKTDELSTLSAELEEKLSPDKIKMEPAVFYPAIRNLSASEIGFMVLYFVFFIILILSKNRIDRLHYLLITSIIAGGIAGTVWHYSVPVFFDTTNYKDLAFTEDTKWFIFPVVPYGENENITSEVKQKPDWILKDSNKKFSNMHWLGTDTTGRDVLSRMIYGARISVTIGVVAVSIYITIGIIIGAISGFFGGWVDITISRIIEIVICFPFFFLILTVISYLKPSIYNIMIIFGLIGWTGIARLERGEFMRLVNQDFVHAVRALGGSRLRIIFLHILPNALGPILVSASFGIASAIIAESSLSFLGFGVPQPAASWGTLLKDGQTDIQGTWWLTIFPGFAIFITVTAFNLLGEGLRDAIDPKLIE